MQKISSSENLENLNIVLIVYTQSTFNIQSDWAIKTHIKTNRITKSYNFYDLKSRELLRDRKDEQSG